MTNEQQNKLIVVLERMSGEDVLHLFLDFHGTQLLCDGFAEHCIDEGKVDADEIDFEGEDE